MDHRNRNEAGEGRETGQAPGDLGADDATLLRRYAQERDERAFAELVRRHLDGVHASALRRVGGDAHLAQDVAQQVFAAAARQAGSLPGHALSGWLYTATRNVAGSLVRAERRRKAREQEASTMEKILSPTAAEAPSDWSRVAPVLDSALDALREPERQIVLWRFVDRRPFAEIGAALQVSEDAARMRVERALEKLRTGLARRGIASTSAALGVALAQNIATAAPASLAAFVAQSALVAAPVAAGGSTLLFLHTMAQAKLTAVVAAGVALLALGIATYQVAAHRRAEAGLAADMQSYTALAARQRAVETRIRLGDATSPPIARSAPRPPTVIPGGAAPVGTVMGWDPKAEGRALLARHPELRQAMMATVRADLEAEYGQFFRTQGLTPQQIAEFTAIQSAGYRFRSQLGSDGKHYEFALGEGYATSDLRRLLGDAVYQNLRTFDDDGNLRWTVSRLARDLGFSTAPLAPAQASQLTEIVARHRPKGVIDVEAYAWPAIFAEAETVLQPMQLAALRRMIAENQASRAAEREAHP